MKFERSPGRVAFEMLASDSSVLPLPAASTSAIPQLEEAPAPKRQGPRLLKVLIIGVLLAVSGVVVWVASAPETLSKTSSLKMSSSQSKLSGTSKVSTSSSVQTGPQPTSGVVHGSEPPSLFRQAINKVREHPLATTAIIFVVVAAIALAVILPSLLSKPPVDSSQSSHQKPGSTNHDITPNTLDLKSIIGGSVAGLISIVVIAVIVWRCRKDMAKGANSPGPIPNPNRPSWMRFYTAPNGDGWVAVPDDVAGNAAYQSAIHDNSILFMKAAKRVGYLKDRAGRIIVKFLEESPRGPGPFKKKSFPAANAFDMCCYLLANPNLNNLIFNNTAICYQDGTGEWHVLDGACSNSVTYSDLVIYRPRSEEEQEGFRQLCELDGSPLPPPLKILSIAGGNCKEIYKKINAMAEHAFRWLGSPDYHAYQYLDNNPDSQVPPDQLPLLH